MIFHPGAIIFGTILAGWVLAAMGAMGVFRKRASRGFEVDGDEGRRE